MDCKIEQQLHDGVVIPAHPLALNADRRLDEHRQRALTRYYIDAGAGGIAVGVHTTQFEIRDPNVDLFESVLRLAADEMDRADRPLIKVAGLCGPTEQACKEAQMAKKYGYHIGLLSPGGLEDLSEADLLKRAQAVAEIIPVFGFYLQPSVGGRQLSGEFWQAFAEIPNVKAIKIAPFNRYHTLDVVKAVCRSSRRDEIALYTGNDDHIVSDLLTTFRFEIDGQWVEKQFAGGLLGHWAVWTQKAVQLLDKIKEVREGSQMIPEDLLSMAVQVTDANAAIFDAANQFKGCIAGIHEVLRRQGLLEGRWCLNPEEELSPGQMDEITRVYQSYPDQNDDDFIQANLEKWLEIQKC